MKERDFVMERSVLGQAKAMGDGNASEGFRLALSAYQKPLESGSVRIRMRMDDADYEMARQYGDGNASLGLRRAIAQASERTHTKKAKK